MITVEQIALLGNINRALKDIETSKVINITFLQKIQEFMEAEYETIDSFVLKNNRYGLLIEMEKRIESIEKRYHHLLHLIENFNGIAFLQKHIRFEQSIFDNEAQKLQTFGTELRELQRSYDFKASYGTHSNPDENKITNELAQLEKHINHQKNKYNLQQKVVKETRSLLHKKMNANVFVVSVNFDLFIEKLSSTKESIKESLSISTRENAVFKDPTILTAAYVTLVKQKRLELMPIETFNLQLNNIQSELTLKKQPKVDMYIAYIIDILKEHVFEEIRNEWESRMIKYFELEKIYSKKKTVSEEYKNQNHIDIDVIFQKISEL